LAAVVSREQESGDLRRLKYGRKKGGCPGGQCARARERRKGEIEEVNL